MHVALHAGNPIIRPLATFVFLCLVVYCLLAHWEQHSGAIPVLGKMGNLDIHVRPGAGLARPGVHVTQSAGGSTPTSTPVAGEHDSPPSGGQERRVVAHFMVGAASPR